MSEPQGFSRWLPDGGPSGGHVHTFGVERGDASADWLRTARIRAAGFHHGFRVGVVGGVLLSGLAVAAAVVARASVGL